MSLDTASCRDIQKVMEQELQRGVKGLHLVGHPKPFFMSYLLQYREGLTAWGRYGSVFNSDQYTDCDLYAEVRLGSYKLDQTVDGGLNTDLADRDSFNWVPGPQDLKSEAIRYALWKLTQHKYFEALKDYYDKKKILVEQHLPQKGLSFTKEPKLSFSEPVEPVRFSRKKAEDFVRRSSDLFRNHRNLLDPYVNLRFLNHVRVFVSSEGTRFITQEKYFEAVVKAWHLTDEGVYLSSAKYLYGRHDAELPKAAEIEEAIEEIAADLADLKRSKPMDPYAGPALLSGAATGLIFHEAIGHRLEGERMTSRSEGRTFASKVGKRILPESVDLIDDPTLTEWDGQSLYGHYRVDDEGVRAEPVTLVEDGVLKNFLLSRSGVPGFTRSNGHGRRERHQDPMARMANLVVKSKEQYEWSTLKEMLMKSTRDRGLPYGIMITRVSSGETRTDRYDFQAFKGIPTAVFTVDPKTGRETRVRDVSFIGTPLAAIQRIRAFGRDYYVDNSYCFAESGSVPVSTIAPAMLVEELELQKAHTNYYRPPVLAMPPMKTTRRR